MNLEEAELLVEREEGDIDLTRRPDETRRYVEHLPGVRDDHIHSGEAGIEMLVGTKDRG